MVKDKGELTRPGKFSVRREGKIESCNHEEVNWGKPERASSAENGRGVSENLSEGRREENLSVRRPIEKFSKKERLSENLSKSKGLSEN